MSKGKPTPIKAGIDTNVLIHALVDPNEKVTGQKAMLVKRSKWLLRELVSERCEIYVSIISLAEYLVRVSEDRHDQTIQAMETQFRIAPFNFRAARECSVLVTEAKRILRSDGSRQVGERSILMADSKIIASLVAANVDRIYTHDRKAMEIANIRVKAELVPETPTNLFDYSEHVHGSEP